VLNKSVEEEAKAVEKKEEEDRHRPWKEAGEGGCRSEPRAGPGRTADDRTGDASYPQERSGDSGADTATYGRSTDSALGRIRAWIGGASGKN